MSDTPENDSESTLKGGFNRTKAALDSPQLRRGYYETPLGRKLALAGLSISNLAKTSQTSKADVSHYLHGRKGKIGRARKARILNAPRQMGIVKHRTHSPSVCRHCGTVYPTRMQVQSVKKT